LSEGALPSQRGFKPNSQMLDKVQNDFELEKQWIKYKKWMSVLIA